MISAPVWCWIMPVRNRRSNAAPLAFASASICCGVNMPGISGIASISICCDPSGHVLHVACSMEIGLPRSSSHCFMNWISSDLRDADPLAECLQLFALAARAQQVDHLDSLGMVMDHALHEAGVRLCRRP